MDDYMSFNYYPPPNPEMFPPPQQVPVMPGIEDVLTIQPKTNDPPPPPPIVICPTEVDHINVTLERNQQCECKDCGKLFNSVWYLKQHAVKHSNDRPFKCKFCFKTYKFRSNLYQHKCPERQKSLQQRRRGGSGLMPSSKRSDGQILKPKMDAPVHPEDPIAFPMPIQNCYSEPEDNDTPITYGLVIQNIDQQQLQQQQQQQQEMMQQQQQQMQEQQMQQMHNYQNFPMQMQPVGDPLMNDMENHFDKNVDFDSVRGQQLPPQQIEDFVQKNKKKLHSCRKCGLLYPDEEALLRHNASHSGDDLFPYKCTECRQAFDTDKELRRHTDLHSHECGPWRCIECCGQFRSQFALRRHKDQCRPCFLPPVQNNIMVSVASPFDPFSFIPDENLFMPVCDELAHTGTDSGVGSEGSPNSMSQASPDRPSGIEDSFSYVSSTEKKDDKEDDEDSGFRSRLNSVTHSCSPDSFSSHCDSPPRKMSGGTELSGPAFLGGYGSGSSYGQQLIYDKSLDDIECDNYGMIKETTLLPKQQLISFRTDNVQMVELGIAPVVQYHMQSISMKEFCMSNEVSQSDEFDFDRWYDDQFWKNDGYDRPPEIKTPESQLIAILFAMYAIKIINEYALAIEELAKLSLL